jgi:hypothetical protein
LVHGVSWEHEQYDAQGHLVARYISFDEVDARGQHSSGWEKYGAEGQLLEVGGPLPPDVAPLG